MSADKQPGNSDNEYAFSALLSTSARVQWTRGVQAAAIAVLGSMFAFSSAAAFESTYPARSLNLIVPFEKSEAGAVVADLLAPQLAEQLGQRVELDLRSAARGTEGAAAAARAPHDGYTTLIGNTMTHVLAPLTMKVSYRPREDFDPVTFVAIVPYVLAVRATVRARSLEALVALTAKASRELHYSSLGDPLGSIGMELLRSTARMPIARLRSAGTAPEKGVAESEAEAFFASLPALAPHTKSGALRPIAVSTRRRAAAFPDVPTIAESGYPMFAVVDWYAVFVPRGAPARVIHRLHVALSAAVHAPEVKSGLLDFGAEPLTTFSNIHVLQRIRADSQRYAKVIEASKVQQTR